MELSAVSLTFYCPTFLMNAEGARSEIAISGWTRVIKIFFMGKSELKILKIT
jgi:hypothetical protein